MTAKDIWVLGVIRAGLVVVTTDGRVWSVLNGAARRLKTHVHKKSGRHYVNVTANGVTRSILVNRLVALVFLPNPEKLPEVNHKDGDKGNNDLSNLEWASRSKNERHAQATGLKGQRGSANPFARLTAEKVHVIRANLGPHPSKHMQQMAAIEYGVSESAIRDVIKRRTWRHI